MKNKLQNENGFTLVETLFGIAIFIMIALALAMFSRNTWISNTFVSESLANSEAGRLILRNMTAEIRTASTADTGAYIISAASSSGFTFYSDIDNDGLKDKVRYFLTGSSLQKGVIKPTGSPLSYDPANEKITTLISYVTNTSIFSYYDKNYEGTTTALSSPVDISSIRLVKITVTIDKDVARPPAATTLTTQVSLRNLKDNL